MRVHLIEHASFPTPTPLIAWLALADLMGAGKGYPPPPKLNLSLCQMLLSSGPILGPNKTAPVLWIIFTAFPQTKSLIAIFTRQSRTQVTFCVLSMCTHKTQRALMKVTLVSMKGIYFSPNHVCYNKVSVSHRIKLSAWGGMYLWNFLKNLFCIVWFGNEGTG